MPPEKMQATVYMGPGELEYRTMDVPELGPGDVLVRVNRALICGTDLKTYRRGHPKYVPPTLFGHEFAGEIVTVGDQVERFQAGMRVVAANTAPCNRCYYCKRGQHNLCDDLMVNLGAFAEFIRVPERIVQQSMFAIPDTLLNEHAAAMEPLACVVHGQDLLQIQPGESVVIIGAGGPIGLMHLQLALRQGASPVIAVDLSKNRLKTAAQQGATVTVNPKEENAEQIVRDLTEGRGADVVIESAGAKQAWLDAVTMARKGGRVQWFGGLAGGTEIPVDAVRVHYDELTLYGVYHATPLTFERAFHMIAQGVVDIQPMITGELPLARLEEALNMMLHGECIKMAIEP
jgi:L-iditol 2-dehydrogenase